VVDSTGAGGAVSTHKDRRRDGVIIEDPDAHYLKIDVTTTQGDVVVTGFVNSRETEERLIGKIRELRGVKSVKSLLRVEERK